MALCDWGGLKGVPAGDFRLCYCPQYDGPDQHRIGPPGRSDVHSG